MTDLLLILILLILLGFSTHFVLNIALVVVLIFIVIRALK